VTSEARTGRVDVAAEPGRSDAFVSYAHEDREYVDELVEHLTRAGVTLWIDRRDLLPSARWMAELEDGIRRSDALLFVLSPDSVTSPVCLAELQHAVEAHKRVLPIAHRPVSHGEVPDALAGVQWTDGAQTDQIVRGLRTDPDHVRLHTRLFTRAWQWRDRGRRRSGLLRGAELAEAAAWLSSSPTDPAPTDLHREYVAAGQAAARWRKAGASAAAVVLALSAVIGAVTGSRALDASQSRDLAARAVAMAPLRADSAMWLGRLALDESATPEAREALLTALRTEPRLLRYLSPPPDLPSLADDPISRRLVRSPDGSRLAIGRAGGSVDILTGDGVTTLHRVSVPWQFDALAFAPDNRTLAVADDGYTTDQRVALVDTVAGRVVDELTVPRDPAAGRDDFLNMITPPPLAIGSDGLLVVAGTDFALHGYDLVGKRWTMTARGHANRVTALALSPDELVYSASWGGPVVVHDRTGQEIGQLVPFDGQSTVVRSVWSLAVRPGGDGLSAGTSEGTVLSWTRPAGSTDPGSWIRESIDAGQVIKELVYNTDGTILGAAGDANRLLLLRMPEGEPAGPPISAPLFLTTGAAFSADSGSVVWGLRDDGTLGQWTVDGPGPLGRPATAPSRVVAVAGGPDHGVATGSPDGTITVAGTLHHDLRDGVEPALAALAFDGSTLVSAATDGSVVRWDVTTGRVASRQDSGQEASAAALSADGRRAAFAGFDDRIRVIDTGSGRVLLDIAEADDNVVGLALDAAGSQLAVGDEGGGVRVARVEPGAVPRVLTGHDNYVRALAFAPDGRTVASGSDDGTVRIHDSASGAARGPAITLDVDGYADDDDSIRSIAFSADGTTLAVGVEQNRVALLQVATGRRTGPALDAWPGAVECVARPCDPVQDVLFDGDVLLAGTDEQGVIDWDLASEHWPAAVCARAPVPSARDALTVPGC
jgi:WD40 repeat protein